MLVLNSTLGYLVRLIFTVDVLTFFDIQNYRTRQAKEGKIELISVFGMWIAYAIDSYERNGLFSCGQQDQHH